MREANREWPGKSQVFQLLINSGEWGSIRSNMMNMYWKVSKIMAKMIKIEEI